MDKDNKTLSIWIPFPADIENSAILQVPCILWILPAPCPPLDWKFSRRVRRCLVITKGEPSTRRDILYPSERQKFKSDMTTFRLESDKWVLDSLVPLVGVWTDSYSREQLGACDEKLPLLGWCWRKSYPPAQGETYMGCLGAQLVKRPFQGCGIEPHIRLCAGAWSLVKILRFSPPPHRPPALVHACALSLSLTLSKEKKEKHTRMFFARL